MSWKEVSLGDGIHVKHGYAFKSQYFSEDGRYIVLTPGNFYEHGGFRLRPEKDRAYTGDIPEDFILSEGDVIVALTEQGPGLLGSSALIPEDDRFLHNQRLGLIDRIDSTLFDKLFLYYLFNTRSVRQQISGSASGTKVRHTAPERIYRVKVKVPDTKTQRTIALSLKDYDDLIENNRRRIQLLEGSARMLYKEWFVQLRFPGHEHVKVLDGVPEGWEKKTVGDASSYISRGITPEYDDEASGLVINQKCIRDHLLNLELARHQKRTVSAEKLVRCGDVLVNSTGTGTLGRVAQVIDRIENCTVDSHVTIVRPKEDSYKFYLGLFLTSMESQIAEMGRGATNQTELSRASIACIPLLIPPSSLATEFSDFASNVFRQISNLSVQNTRLAQARNLLLPRLMNGDIPV